MTDLQTMYKGTPGPVTDPADSVSLRRPRGRASTWGEEVRAMQTTKDAGFLFCGVVRMTLTMVWGEDGWELKSWLFC